MNALGILLTTLSGLGASWLLQKSKSHIDAWDTKAGDWIRPAQPIIVVGLSMIAPFIASKTGIDIGDPSLLVNAPLSGIIGVVASEYLKKINGGQTPLTSNEINPGFVPNVSAPLPERKHK